MLSVAITVLKAQGKTCDQLNAILTSCNQINIYVIFSRVKQLAQLEQPTSRRGALINHIWTNTSALAAGVTMSYCSDHDIIWAAIRVAPGGDPTPASHPGHASIRHRCAHAFLCCNLHVHHEDALPTTAPMPSSAFVSPPSLTTVHMDFCHVTLGLESIAGMRNP